MLHFLKRIFGSRDSVRVSDTTKAFFYPTGDFSSMDELMAKSGYENIRLRGAEVDMYAPVGCIMVHANYSMILESPVKTPWGEGCTHGGMRRVYRRTEEVEDSHIVFVYNPDDDR